MTTITFDTLAYFEKFVSAGMPEAQARVQVEAMQDMVQQYDQGLRQELATKWDTQELRVELKKEIQGVRDELHNVKFDLMKWMLGIAIGQAALIIALFAFIK
jgi:TPR repeat protein